MGVGTGSYEEALAWVEYCNGTGDTQYVDFVLSPVARRPADDSWANLRRKNTGRDEPHKVMYWGLGNESESSAGQGAHGSLGTMAGR
jgi:alpha-N-arabinofuranosidase